MIDVTKHGVILEKTDFGFENEGVLNPAAIREGDVVHLFYRAVRKGNYSTIGYCRLEGPLEVVERFDMPVLFPQANYEVHGVEDPRIAKIDEVYYLTYTAYDGVNALGAYATACTLPHFEKKGILTAQITYEDFRRLAESKSKVNNKYLRYNGHPTLYDNADKKTLVWDKNIVFFPRRINHKLHFLHRIKPDIQLVAVDNLDELTSVYWEDYFMHLQDHIVLESKHRHEVSYIGAGCPPIETKLGWLIIYHGVHDTPAGYKYVACAALLDLENPIKEIARLPYALFTPEFDYETRGEVNNVCFPTGAALFDDRLYIYYGAADERIACASVSLAELLAELTQNTTKHE
ncbi:MAG TPA: pesticidal protein Cry7Aa [Haliscomenobacter sp.]|uniref:glycoside hydrolase family 130 protein n=1 Tax=Haliscomenobacter sp. TaxID=2717303 RepID=UPI002D0AFE7E|nr:pesticidal protein Cry7Aa [Haliscomenobacter sp.]HOY17727.1 pesticidal protein Cry7Aa [Haliscomenobacter sp.]